METFFSLLERRVQDASSLLCVGLDPHPSDLPKATPEHALDYCRRIVDQTSQYAAAFKPNAAFFEVYGAQGVQNLHILIAHIVDKSYAAGSRIPVVLDAKRGDISSTAYAYADAIFNHMNADCVTLNPYLGSDSIQPFLEEPERGVFVLCKTSNPGAAELQDLMIQTQGPAEPLYLRVARLGQKLNINNNVGLVVGATQLDALARVRQTVPGMWFLSPGVGAQGGDLEAALQAGLRSDGMGMLIPVSRGIARAEDPRQAAAALRDQIAQVQYVRSKPQPAKKTPEFKHAALAEALLDLECVRFGKFTLKSGLVSPFYIDLRRLVADPKTLALVADAFHDQLKALSFDSLAALPYAAMPIGTAVSLRGNWPMIYPRKEVKEYGTRAVIEGHYEAGQTVAVVDDLITTGGSKFEGIDKLTLVGLNVKDVVVLIDRSAGNADKELAERGVQLHAVFAMHDLLDYWENSGLVGEENISAARDFLMG